MKKIILASLVCFTGIASAQTYVKPHVRSDGTFVQGHVRSAPNGTRSDNYGTQGNMNPYTGQMGTLSPYNPNGR